jgi:hydroxymethylbilane synthase
VTSQPDRARSAGDPLVIATRGSLQARTQAEHVAQQLRDAHPGLDVVLELVKTTGDVRTDVPLHQIGGQGVFVKEVQQAVLDGRADLAVHSAKDLPSVTADGLVIAAVPRRRDPRDALVGRALDDLAEGATVATGSVRRQALLRAMRPDLHFADLRGNITSRLEKVPPGGAIVMAAAALEIVGLTDRIAQLLEPHQMLPQVGQGAVAVECRTDDDEVRRLLTAIEHRDSRRRVDAERAYLAGIGGGCDKPVAAHATLGAYGFVVLEGLLVRDDGVVVRHRASANDPAAVGATVARAVLAGSGA